MGRQSWCRVDSYIDDSVGVSACYPQMAKRLERGTIVAIRAPKGAGRGSDGGSVPQRRCCGVNLGSDRFKNVDPQLKAQRYVVGSHRIYYCTVELE